MSEKELTFLIELFEKHNIVLEKRQACQFYKYYELLVSWNEKINLTAITNYEDVCIKHFLDSASIINMFSSYKEMVSYFSGKTIIDVGTGAGFPGIPLKILIPDLNVVLADSLDKRVNFLNTVISELELDGISAVHGRVEDLAKSNEYREAFDFSTARAVAALPVLSEYCIPFVKVDGLFIAYKSEKAAEEVSSSERALSLLGGKIVDSKSFSIFDMKREIIYIKKVSSTPKQYPRKAGTPSKKPL